MHLYLKQTISFELFDDQLKDSSLSKKELAYLKNILYSIVFHKILDLTLSSLTEQAHKEYILKSIENEPDVSEMENFLESNIKSHKEKFKKVSRKNEIEVLEMILPKHKVLE